MKCGRCGMDFDTQDIRFGAKDDWHQIDITTMVKSANEHLPTYHNLNDVCESCYKDFVAYWKRGKA